MSDDDGAADDRAADDGAAGGQAADGRAAEGPNRCDFCRLLIPGEAVAGEHEGETYEFCCAECRRRFEDTERVFTEYHGYRRIDPGVAGLRPGLPQGLPRNAFVLLSGQAGTRDQELHAELVWRTLERDEPAAVVTFREPPGSVVQSFVSMDWNVLPYLESGQLHLLDCFTYRLDDRERMFDRMNDWNQHLYEVAEDATTVVRDPSDVGALENNLDNCLEALDASDRGMVLVDSLTELGTLLQPVQAYDFVKDVRAEVCKGRFVPVFAGATYRGEPDGFPHDLEYVVDGIVDQRLNGEVVPGSLLKEVRIRKMNGVLAIPEWTAYEYTSGIGMVTFDPEEEMQKSAQRRAGGGDGGGTGGDAPDPAGETEAPDGSVEASEGPETGDADG